MRVPTCNVFSAILWPLGYMTYMICSKHNMFRKNVRYFGVNVYSVGVFWNWHLSPVFFRFYRLRVSFYLLSWSVDSMPIAWKPLVQIVCSLQITSYFSILYRYVCLHMLISGSFFIFWFSNSTIIWEHGAAHLQTPHGVD